MRIFQMLEFGASYIRDLTVLREFRKINTIFFYVESCHFRRDISGGYVEPCHFRCDISRGIFRRYRQFQALGGSSDSHMSVAVMINIP